jgi:hypothetical protein
VQVDPIKPTLKPPGTKRLKLNYDQVLSNSAFEFILRRYTKAAGGAGGGHLGGKLERMLLAGVGEAGRELADGQRRYIISTAGNPKP